MNATSIIGQIDDQMFVDRVRHHVHIGWGDAAKHRQVAIADSGLTVHLTLPRGTFLRDGAVIADDGTAIVVVRRPAEDALVVGFDDNSDVAGARRMLLLGYLLGNQHAPIDVNADRIAAPLFTSPQAAETLLTELGIVGDVASVVLAADGWSRTSSDSHVGHH